MRFSDWSSYVCSSDLPAPQRRVPERICPGKGVFPEPTIGRGACCLKRPHRAGIRPEGRGNEAGTGCRGRRSARSEEHTSELQSLMRISYAVFCLKKKRKSNKQQTNNDDILNTR